jgi:hypothetical protein
MPLFGRSGSGRAPPPYKKEEEPPKNPPGDSARPQRLVFHCQQAQGSPVGLLSEFSSVKELYAKISDCYDFPPQDVSFITFH